MTGPDAYGCESVRPALCCSMRICNSKNLRKKLILAGLRGSFFGRIKSGLSARVGVWAKRCQRA